MNPDLKLLNSLAQPFNGDLYYGVNPLSAALEARLLDYDRANRLMRISFAPPARYRGAEHRIGRAAAAIMLDFPVGVVGLTVLDADQAPASTRFDLLFIASSDARRFIATGWVIGRHGNTVFTRGELHDEHGTLCATAQSTLSAVPTVRPG